MVFENNETMRHSGYEKNECHGFSGTFSQIIVTQRLERKFDEYDYYSKIS